MCNSECVSQATAMAEAALRNGDLAEAEVECAPKVLELVLQACRGRVDQCVGHYIALALDRHAFLHALRARTRTSHAGLALLKLAHQDKQFQGCYRSMNSTRAVPLSLLSLFLSKNLRGKHAPCLGVLCSFPNRGKVNCL